MEGVDILEGFDGGWAPHLVPLHLYFQAGQLIGGGRAGPCWSPSDGRGQTAANGSICRYGSRRVAMGELEISIWHQVALESDDG